MTRVRVQTFEETGATGEVWIRDTASAVGGAYGAVPGGTADFLGTTGADVDVGSSAPPSVGQVLTATSATTATWQTPSGGGGGGNGVTATVDFGASFTDKAQVIVTGQTWVAAGSEIVATPKVPAGVDPDEMRLLGFDWYISDLVAGTGFTLTVYSEPEARGTYDFFCIGV